MSALPEFGNTILQRPCGGVDVFPVNVREFLDERFGIVDLKQHRRSNLLAH